MSGMEASRNNSAMSLHLSRVLDGAGVSKRTVNKRRQAWLKMEYMHSLFPNVYLGLSDDDFTSYFFGSQIEGSTSLKLESDIDVLQYCNNVTAIQNMREWKHDKANILVLQGGDIPVGYCRLQVVSMSAINIIPDWCDLTLDSKARFILKYNVIGSPEQTVNGPAVTTTGLGGTGDVDYVYGFKCDSVSNQVKPWIKRVQDKQWPNRDMLKTATESGFFIVPVGHRLSETLDVEWRVSPSLTERCLMFGMNITQIKCYIILKMIKKDLIIPKIGESISSFHLKTALFHCVENTPTLWRDEKLIACIDVCLKYLLSCVQKRSCPNYLIPKENLFSGRIKEMQIPHIKKILNELIESDGFYLFDISCDNIGEILDKCLDKYSTINRDMLVLDEGGILGWCEIAHNLYLLANVECFLIHASNNQLQKQIAKLRNMLNQSYFKTKLVAKNILHLMYSAYGSMLASMCIRGGIGLTRGVLSYLERGCGYDLMSGSLKKASALYCCGQYTEAASVLEDLESRYDFRCVQPVCSCNSELPKLLKQEFKRSMCLDNIKPDDVMFLASHVSFTKHDINCCPLSLRFDMFCAHGDDRAHLRPIDRWMEMAAVDSVIFLYFLMYLTYGSMGNRQLQLNALDNLISSLSTKKEHYYIRHYETAFNLLGQCFEMDGKPGDALLCYRMSLQRIPRNNPASWLVALLIYKYFCPKLVCVNEIISNVLKY